MDSSDLITRYVFGRANADEVRQLEIELAEDAKLRTRFIKANQLDAGLREIAIERSSEPITPLKIHSATTQQSLYGKWIGPSLLVAIAAAILVMLGIQNTPLRSQDIATLLSSEEAAWESDLPTTPGSQLVPGTMKLRSGVAIIRFDSGAEVLLEAPAELQLLSAMKGRLVSGAAVIEVPDSAIGFVIETPDGYAVDYGTRFAVRVDAASRKSAFEIVEGEIAVHHPDSGDEMRLTGQGGIATIRDGKLTSGAMIDEGPGDMKSTKPGENHPPSPRMVRIRTNARSDSVLRNNRRDKFIDREILSVKRQNRNGKWDHRSFFAFDLSNIEITGISQARLRLNLVPSVRGFASRLPETSRFGVCGLTDDSKSDWQIGETWEQSPAPQDGVLLGTFDVPRSTQRGTFGFSNDTLLEFIKSRIGASVTLILVRETSQIPGDVPGLTHAFASDLHPESVGPLLEFSYEL